MMENRGIKSRQKLLLVLIAGLVIRLAFIWMPGTEDVYAYRTWGALALRAGILNVYTWNDEVIVNVIFMRLHGVDVRLHTKRTTDVGSTEGIPDYPPGNIWFLEMSVGICKILQGGALRPGHLLNACLNLFPVLFSLATAIAVWLFARGEGAPGALAAVAALWLNPALILASPVLGYQDPMFAFLGLLALLSFYRDRHVACVLFLALSCVTKPQGVFIVPVLAAAFWAEGGWKALARATTRFLFFFLLLLLPFIIAGRLLTPVASVFRGTIFPALSAQMANVWWIAGPALQSVAVGSLDPFLGEVQMVPESAVRPVVGINLIWLSLAALVVFTLVNLYWVAREVRAGNRQAVFWAAALETYGYTMLALFVHENHLYAFFVYAAPLIALGHRPARHLYVGLSVIFGLNLYFFDGLGQGIEAFNHWVRRIVLMDLAIPLALANVGIFIFLMKSRRWSFGDTTGKTGRVMN